MLKRELHLKEHLQRFEGLLKAFSWLSFSEPRGNCIWLHKLPCTHRCSRAIPSLTGTQQIPKGCWSRRRCHGSSLVLGNCAVTLTCAWPCYVVYGLYTEPLSVLLAACPGRLLWVWPFAWQHQVPFSACQLVWESCQHAPDFLKRSKP